MGARSRALLMEAGVVVGREEESIRAEGVAIDLTEIVSDLTGASVSVLKLQDGLGHFAGGCAHLDGAAVIGRGEDLGIRARLGGKGVLWGAGGRVLPTHVEIHGKIAVVANVGVTSRTGCYVGVCGDRIAAVWYGRGVSGGGGVHNPGLAGWDGGG